MSNHSDPSPTPPSSTSQKYSLESTLETLESLIHFQEPKNLRKMESKQQTNIEAMTDYIKRLNLDVGFILKETKKSKYQTTKQTNIDFETFGDSCCGNKRKRINVGFLRIDSPLCRIQDWTLYISSSDRCQRKNSNQRRSH